MRRRYEIRDDQWDQIFYFQGLNQGANYTDVYFFLVTFSGYSTGLKKQIHMQTK